MKMQDMKMQDMKLLHILIVLLFYVGLSDVQLFDEYELLWRTIFGIWF